MEISSLRQLLMSLCHNSQWEYAVFWNLKHRSQMFLTWEDGYCNYPRQREPMQGVSNNVNFSETTSVASFDYETTTSFGTSATYPIGLAVASMSCLLYSFGEGFVGRVASTGKHCWIIADEINSKLPFEYPDEWQLQFKVGIKTILLVPVVPHGVLQLGSLEKVSEDVELLAHIKDMFNTLQHVPAPSVGEPSSNASDILDLNLTELNVERDHIARDGVQKAQNGLSTVNWDMAPQFGDDDFRVQGRNQDYKRDAEFSAVLMDPTAVPFPPSQISNESHKKITEPYIPDFSCLGDLQCSQSNSTKLRFAEQSNLSMNFYPAGEMMNQLSEDGTGNETDRKSLHGFLNFPSESELHKALVPAFLKRCIENDPIIVGEDVCSDSNFMYHTDFTRDFESIGETIEWFIGEGDAGSLLDTVISNSFDASGDIASNRSSSVQSPTTSASWFIAPCETQSQSRCHVLGNNHVDLCDSTRSGFVSQQGSPSGSSLKSRISCIIDDGQQNKGRGRAQSRKGAKLSHFGQKKVRHGDVGRPKPRPRDRQMIQDRVKELRELVPKGAKCSIDALLDQTIKHMVFLRSVTSRAEKLRKCAFPEVADTKSSNSSETQGHQNGASWAFEIGSQFGVCPIVVKDLDQPGHMLIEMLCEEHELFLEIAQVIRQLKLTVLKGVLEPRSDKTWAHFVVEGFKEWTSSGP